MLGGAVVAPHVAGIERLGSVCCDLMLLSSVSTDKLSLLSKESGVVGEGSDARESASMVEGATATPSWVPWGHDWAAGGAMSAWARIGGCGGQSCG
jgi:hypothetical protein